MAQMLEKEWYCGVQLASSVRDDKRQIGTDSCRIEKGGLAVGLRPTCLFCRVHLLRLFCLHARQLRGLRYLRLLEALVTAAQLLFQHPLRLLLGLQACGLLGVQLVLHMGHRLCWSGRGCLKACGLLGVQQVLRVGYRLCWLQLSHGDLFGATSGHREDDSTMRLDMKQLPDCTPTHLLDAVKAGQQLRSL
eukprot:1160477-Pelagomonas_calceolata.AAC.9